MGFYLVGQRLEVVQVIESGQLGEHEAVVVGSGSAIEGQERGLALRAGGRQRQQLGRLGSPILKFSLALVQLLYVAVNTLMRS